MKKDSRVSLCVIYEASIVLLKSYKFAGKANVAVRRMSYVQQRYINNPRDQMQQVKIQNPLQFKQTLTHTPFWVVDEL